MVAYIDVENTFHLEVEEKILVDRSPCQNEYLPHFFFQNILPDLAMIRSVTFVHQKVGPPKLASSPQSLESMPFHPSRDGNVLCSPPPAGARSRPCLCPRLLCLLVAVPGGLRLPSQAVPGDLTFAHGICSAAPQAQHLPPGMHGPAGAHVPAQHPRHEAALPALRHGAVVQRRHRRGRPGEQHPPDPVHHSHCALRPEHVSISARRAAPPPHAPLPDQGSAFSCLPEVVPEQTADLR